MAKKNEAKPAEKPQSETTTEKPTKAKLWKAEVTYPFQIRVPVDIAIEIGARTVLVKSADQDLPLTLVDWLKQNPFSGHKHKLA